MPSPPQPAERLSVMKPAALTLKQFDSLMLDAMQGDKQAQKKFNALKISQVPKDCRKTYLNIHKYGFDCGFNNYYNELGEALSMQIADRAEEFLTAPLAGILMALDNAFEKDYLIIIKARDMDPTSVLLTICEPNPDVVRDAEKPGPVILFSIIRRKGLDPEIKKMLKVKHKRSVAVFRFFDRADPDRTADIAIARGEDYTTLWMWTTGRRKMASRHNLTDWQVIDRIH